MLVLTVQVKAAVLPLTPSCRLCAPPRRSAPTLIYPWPKILQGQLLLVWFLERSRKFAGFLKSGRMNNSRHVAAASLRSCQVTYLAGWMTTGESRLWGEAAERSHSDLYFANHVNKVWRTTGRSWPTFARLMDYKNIFFLLKYYNMIIVWYGIL